MTHITYNQTERTQLNPNRHPYRFMQTLPLQYSLPNLEYVSDEYRRDGNPAGTLKHNISSFVNYPCKYTQNI